MHKSFHREKATAATTGANIAAVKVAFTEKMLTIMSLSIISLAGPTTLRVS